MHEGVGFWKGLALLFIDEHSRDEDNLNITCLSKGCI